MTQKQTLAAIRSLGLSATMTEHKEIRVTFPLDSFEGARSHRINKAEQIAYYATDRQDALQTAQFMAARLPLKVR